MFRKRGDTRMVQVVCDDYESITFLDDETYERYWNMKARIYESFEWSSSRSNLKSKLLFFNIVDHWVP